MCVCVYATRTKVHIIPIHTERAMYFDLYSLFLYLQGVRAKALHLRFYNTSLSHVPANLFHELGRVQNISIDVSGNNKALKKQLNPNTAQHPLESERVYLTDLKISGNSFTCDCEIG